MQHFYLKDIVDEISVRENNPSSSGYDRFVGLEHYVSGEVEIHDFGSTSNLASAMKVFKSGDILIARRNVYLRRAGVVKFDGLTSGDSIVLRAKNERIAKLLPFIFNTSEFWDYADQNADGTMSKRLSPKILLEYEISLPESEEQEKLADLLWAAEETRQAYKKLIAQTDGLVKAKFEEMFGNLKRERLGNYIEQIRGVSYKPSDLNSTLTDDYVTLLRANNINDGVINFDDVQYVHRDRVIEKQFIKTNDILVCASSGSLEHVGKSALCKFNREHTFGAFCKLIRTTGKLKPEYVATYMQTDEYRTIIKNVVNGANINNLRNEHIDDILIPVPTEAQQQVFIEFLQQAEQTKLATQQSLDALNGTVRALVDRNFN